MALSDAAFIERLTEGKEYEQLIVQKLIDGGIPEGNITTHPDVVVDRDRDISDFAKNDKDIVVRVGDNEIILEVKSRRSTCVFTSVEDFPFPDVFLDTEGGWNAKVDKPDYYVVVSQDTGGAIVFSGDTREQWGCRKVYDPACGFATKTLVAPISLAVPFEELVRVLHE